MLAKGLAVLAMAAVAVATAGCANKFTRENFDLVQVKVDDAEDVEHLLGEPRTRLGDMWYYEDEDNKHSALIHFADGRVAGKEWMDAMSGEWAGTSPTADAPPPGETRERSVRTRTVDP